MTNSRLTPISVKSLSVKNQSRFLLDNISIKIESGDFVAVVGHNGAGKSLFINCLAGLSLASNLLSNNLQCITWNNEKMCHDKRTKMSMVFQNPQFLKRSIKGVLLHSLKSRNLSSEAITSQLNWALKIFCKTIKADTLVQSLSGGEKRKLAVVRALMLNPELLIMDEPYVNLDPQNMNEILDLLKKDKKRKDKTIVIATHEIKNIMSLVNKIAVFEYGKLEFFGASNKVEDCPAYQRYLNVTAR